MPSAITETVAHGFHQVERYCHDFGEPYGHLVVFNASERDLPRRPNSGSGGRG